MQTTFAKTFSTRVAAPKAARASRVVVCAQAERKPMAAFAAGLAALTFAAQVQAAATPVQIIDDRKAIATGFDLIYEARDLDLPQNERDGLTQARTSIEDTKKRVSEAKTRITGSVNSYVKKAYWTEAKEELRRQVGTLRFDLNTLAESKGKEGKKEVLALKKEFLTQVESLDFAIRAKSPEKAEKAYAATIASLDKVLSAVL